MSYVYWIYNERCTDVYLDGYVGVSEDVERRFFQHLQKNERIPADSKYMILFEGSREECFKKEHEYRPRKSIGWNSAPGGSQGWKTGFIHSDMSKSRMKEKWNNPERRAKHRLHMQKAAETKRGKLPKQLYGVDKCEFCSIAATKSNITKWHGINCKLNPDNPKSMIGEVSFISCYICGYRCKTYCSKSRGNLKKNHLERCKFLEDL